MPASDGFKRILLADDDPAIRGIIKLILGLDGHSVTEAEDGAQALSWFSKRPYDLVITDFEMPNMKGDELVNAIRRVAPTQRILVVSANWQHLGGSMPTVNGCLPKPFLIADLRAAVRRVLDGA